MKKEKVAILTAFIVASMLIAIVHHYNLDSLKWIDIPTHFIGGMVVGIFLPLSLLSKKPILTISLILIVGVGWELLELATSNFAVNSFIVKISEESAGDKVQDMFFGFAGLIYIYQKQKSIEKRTKKL